MKSGGGVHLKMPARIAQIESALATGPKSPSELREIMQCSDRLVRMYADELPHIGSRIRDQRPRRSTKEYFLKSAEE